MIRRLCLLAGLACLAAPAAAPAAALVRITVGDPAVELPRLEALGFDVTENVRAHRADVVLGSRAQGRALQRAGYPYRTLVAALAAPRAARAAARSALPSARTSYRHYGDYVRELERLGAAHPGLVRTFALPRKTVLGEPILGVEIAQDVNRDDDGRPVYLVMGLHHAREWPSAEIAMEFALDLAAGYGRDPRITSLLERERVVVIPVLNVDGFKISREDVRADPGFGQTADAGTLKRKNCEADTQADANRPCQDRAGVDINRNYGAYWGGNGASATYTDSNYRGPGPWSEPESQAVHELSQGLQITGLETLHNNAGLVLRPPGFRALGAAPDERRMKALGDAMAHAAGYDSEHGYQLYEVTGAAEDWNYVAQGTFGYTIELGGETFQDPYRAGVVDQYLGRAGGVREALLLAGEQAADPADHAIVRGSAPPGRVLRLHKDFQTTTSPVCPVPTAVACPVAPAPRQLDDDLDTTLHVPASGAYVWHVNPSTRPFERKAGRTEAWTLTCESADGVVLDRVGVAVGRGQTATLDLACGTGGTTGVPAVTPTPADPASAAFEARLAGEASRAPSGARLVVGRVVTSARRRHALRVGLVVRGTTLRDVTATLRGADRQVIARARLARLRGRGAVLLRLPRGLPTGAYRVAVSGVAPNGAPLRAAARIVVRR